MSRRSDSCARGAVVSEARSRDDLDSLLRRSPAPHLLYFYRHGGLTPVGLPFLRFGDGRTDEALTPDNLYAWRSAGPSRGRWSS